MVITCIVPCCRARSDRCPHLRYFRIPAVRLNEGDVTRELCIRRRATWIARINRANFGPTAAHRVCSQHFVKGEPSKLYDQANPDWAPSLKLGVRLEVLSHANKEERAAAEPVLAHTDKILSGSTDNEPTEANVKNGGLSCGLESSHGDSLGSRSDNADQSSECVLRRELHVRLVDCRNRLGPSGICNIKDQGGDGSLNGCHGDDQSVPHEGTRSRSVKSYECSGCRKVFLRLHNAAHVSKKPYRCSQCEKEFDKHCNQRPNFRKRKSVCGMEKPHKCSQCDMSFTQMSNLKRHELQHSGELSHVCATCGKVFARQDLLKKHKRLHTRERPYACTQCPKTFSWASSLRHHLTTHGDQTSSNSNSCLSKDHQSTAAEGRPHRCCQCGKIFTRKRHLRMHLQRHAGHRQFLCQYCGKMYRDRNSLTLHQRVHTGEKPFRCRWCDKAFARSTALRCHELQHTGVRPHVCGECGRAFARHDLLRKHQRTHTGEKPYHCAICGKHFGYSASLKNHQKNIHTVMATGAGDLRCPRCTKKFATTQDLREHRCAIMNERSIEDVLTGALQELAKEFMLPLI